MILDYVEIIAAILIFTIGSGFNHLRLLIVASIVVSSLFYTTALHFDVVQSLEPGLYYFNFALPIGVCLMSFVRLNKHTRWSGIPLCLIGLINFIVYWEYYSGASMFYDVYEESMMVLTAWQLLLLIRIGDVGGNLRRIKRYITRRFEHHLANIVWHSGFNGHDYAFSEYRKPTRASFRGRR